MTAPSPTSRLPTTSRGGATSVGGRSRGRRSSVVSGSRSLRWTLEFCVALLAAVGAAFMIVDSTPLANLLAMPLLRVPSSPATADVAVILAGGHYADGSLNQPSIERTIAGVRLYHHGRVHHLLFSGGPCCGAGSSTAALMTELAHDLGVPREAILLEEQSTRTHEGARYSAELIRRHGFGSVILVTSALHLTRARLAFVAAGVPVAPVRASETDLTLVSGTNERIGLLSDAIHEYVGLVFYRLKGWI